MHPDLWLNAIMTVAQQTGESLKMWQAIVLGLVEGITEYLPISSTGHLILASSFMGLGGTPELERNIDDFNIVIQGGAIAAVVGLYWPSLVRMLKGLLGRDEQGLLLLINLVIAFLPAAIVGLLLKDKIEELLFKPFPVLLALGLGGVYMMIADLKAGGRLGLNPMAGSEASVMTLKPYQAFFIGCLQCIAMWPGMSRSMMTITGGIWCGRPRRPPIRAGAPGSSPRAARRWSPLCVRCGSGARR
jgi:undecaprenyl-diphosphatase